MKFVLILACLLAVAYASDASVDEALHKALVEAGVDPDVASGWLSNFASKVGGFVKKAVPYVQKGLDIYNALPCHRRFELTASGHLRLSEANSHIQGEQIMHGMEAGSCLG
ncbi:hypothetical protein pipiens_011717 [Culex pipiens pipiens]|uniref:Uncharacterized protein n=1 Tax=Culex pipiens pipiens TaxID=38569 RepID=A0ABD1D6N2_CULPP